MKNSKTRNQYLLAAIVCFSVFIYFGKPVLDLTIGMIYNYICRKAFNEGYYKIAIHSCTLATEVAPRNTSFYWHLGIVFQRAKKYDEAIDNYNKALTIKSWDLDRDFHRLFGDVVYFNRGVAKFEQQKYQSALEDFETAIQQNPYDTSYVEWRSKTIEILKQQ